MLQKEIHSAEDARQMAKRRLPRMIFDYIDARLATKRER